MAWVSIGSIAALMIAYFMGCIPSAYIAGRLVTGRDIREEGDGNPGAGNAYRTIGPKVGLAVGAIDIGKGAVAILVARGLTGSPGVEMAAGLAVVAGHNWPIFLQLKGGRGAATTVGVLLAIAPIPAIPVGLISAALLPFIKSATTVLAIIMIFVPALLVLLTWLTLAGASYSVALYSAGLPIVVGLRHYFTTRKVESPEEDQPEGQALPQE